MKNARRMAPCRFLAAPALVAASSAQARMPPLSQAALDESPTIFAGTVKAIAKRDVHVDARLGICHRPRTGWHGRDPAAERSDNPGMNRPGQ